MSKKVVRDESGKHRLEQVMNDQKCQAKNL